MRLLSSQTANNGEASTSKEAPRTQAAALRSPDDDGVRAGEIDLAGETCTSQSAREVLLFIHTRANNGRPTRASGNFSPRAINRPSRPAQWASQFEPTRVAAVEVSLPSAGSLGPRTLVLALARACVSSCEAPPPRSSSWGRSCVRIAQYGRLASSRFVGRRAPEDEQSS